jgi:KUP system potassium uptake protein
VLAILGVINIGAAPQIIGAINPMHAVHFVSLHRTTAYIVMGAVVLVVTGVEALYLDMGHFGRNPVRYAWLFIVLPSLLINYLGQGALLLSNPDAVSNPFYLMVPEWALWPVVGLATAATVIASQAVISGAYSLVSQAILLGFMPR